MCWSCNPFCGGCKPPRPKPVKCPGCKTFCFPELKQCQRCGTLLPEPERPEPVMCLSIGKMCATPCNKHRKPPLEGQVNTCKWHRPPDGEGEG